MKKNLLLMVCLMSGYFVNAQVPSLPSDEQLKKIAEQQREANQRLLQSPALNPTAPTVPASPPLLLPSSPSAGKVTDLGQLTRTHTTGASEQDQKPDLLVFVSFSIPDRELVKLAQQATQAGATMVLRGFATDEKTGKSLGARGTQEKIQGLLKNNPQFQAGWIIDPNLFQQINVQRVPALFLGKTPSQECNKQFDQCEKQINGSIVYGESISASLQRISLRSKFDDHRKIAERIFKETGF